MLIEVRVDSLFTTVARLLVQLTTEGICDGRTAFSIALQELENPLVASLMIDND